MSTSTTRAPRARRQPLARSITGHILVATQASNTVAPEVRVARSLADRFGSKVDVVSVVEPILPSPMISDIGLVGTMAPVAPAVPQIQERRFRISDELARAGRPDWNVTVLGGWPAEKIAEAAKQVGATMIVMGIGHHAPIDRLMGSETVLQLIQYTDIPVLAVSRDLPGVPQRAVAAIDFTDQSELAARVASELVADAGTLYLAHVRTDWTETIEPQLPVDLYADGVERRFEQLERRLAEERVAPRVVDRVVRSGDPAHEILAFAGATSIDLIAVGARTHSRMYRIFLGSVAAKLLRSAPCSVLVIPARVEQARRGQTPASAAQGRPATKAR
jgi:nucleotide-binding universal stress UspA family protein